MGQTLLSYLGLVPLIIGFFFSDLDRGFGPVFPAVLQKSCTCSHLQYITNSGANVPCSAEVHLVIYLLKQKKHFLSLTEKCLPDKYVVEKVLLVKLVI